MNARRGPLPPQRPYTIADNQIHLWLAADPDFHDQPVLQQYYGWLTDEEALQRERFHFAKDRHQYLVTRALVRSTLSRYVTSIREAEWRFVTNAYGRPAIGNTPGGGAPPLQFNLSHTSGLIALAVSIEGELGVDVEYLHRDGETVDLAEHFFAPREVEELRALQGSMKQRDRFFDLWTLKESYIKARGMGLSIPLNSFSFSFPADASIELQVEPPAGDRAEGWRFWQMSPTAVHKLALAYRNHRMKGAVELRAWRFLPGQTHIAVPCRAVRCSDAGALSRTG